MFGKNQLFKFLSFPKRSPKKRDIFRDRDKENKKKGFVLNYTCTNGHKWKSHSWPTSGFIAGIYGMKETRCPKCKTEIAMCLSDDGKQGAMHMGFRK